MPNCVRATHGVYLDPSNELKIGFFPHQYRSDSIQGIQTTCRHTDYSRRPSLQWIRRCWYVWVDERYLSPTTLEHARVS
ncbi:hypothetical protein HBI56_003730 [Parastagonospora nodorum]|nr:hypothetical protein HBH53_092420 [Parastagonospora nodorum]KAH4041754.1 hypothetical protein HBI09_004070 [Parastagonospora nodorum]KAH4124312.1 hypothetical protein HBH47_070300 [Parastagonospora nodorum]KAH4166016.1 hypothetical protein HBH43_135400 [Parastagonospora nodorum]KAH4608008.1 hypothetical protein HBH82_083560 [Parastagonospora nodorum]